MRTIEFDTAIYSERAVAQAIRDYQGLASIEKSVRKGAVSCVIRDSKYDLAETCLEFQNHVLALTAAREGNRHDLY